MKFRSQRSTGTAARPVKVKRPSRFASARALDSERPTRLYSPPLSRRPATAPGGNAATFLAGPLCGAIPARSSTTAGGITERLTAARPSDGGGHAERDDNACRHPPVVADDELPDAAGLRVRGRSRRPHLRSRLGRGTKSYVAARRHHHQRHERDPGDDHQQGGVAAGRERAGALGPPEDPDQVSITPTENFIAFSGMRASGARAANPAPTTIATATAAAAAASPIRCWLAPNVRTMNATSRPSSSTPLNAITNEYGVEVRAAASTRACIAASRSARNAASSSWSAFKSGGAENRLAQPLQAEHEQQPADDEAQHVERQRGQRRAERRRRSRRARRTAAPTP